MTKKLPQSEEKPQPRVPGQKKRSLGLKVPTIQSPHLELVHRDFPDENESPTSSPTPPSTANDHEETPSSTPSTPSEASTPTVPSTPSTSSRPSTARASRTGRTPSPSTPPSTGAA